MKFMWMLYLVVVLAGLGLVAAVVAWCFVVSMPGRKFQGPVQPLTKSEHFLREVLRVDLHVLATQIGERNISHCYQQLVRSAEWIESELRLAGYEIRRQKFVVDGKDVWNIEAESTGRMDTDKVIVIGSHYDTVPGSPGANDNGSAVVMNLALARWFANQQTSHTLKFVFLVNEESPYFMTQDMGAYRYAMECRANDVNVIGMISLETLGYYSSKPQSQRYPHPILNWIYPTTGNFVALVGNLKSRHWLRQMVGAFRQSPISSEGMAAPELLRDIFRSDHSAFWHFGYPGIMATDTANFRYPHYHTAEDTPDKIDYESLTRATVAMRQALLAIAE